MTLIIQLVISLKRVHDDLNSHCQREIQNQGSVYHIYVNQLIFLMIED